jgi:hypothetical protein
MAHLYAFNSRTVAIVLYMIPQSVVIDMDTEKLREWFQGWFYARAGSELGGDDGNTCRLRSP